ncbi:MAG TPA: Crp/Fnr family transcriptional regulator [Terriglobales bacterium]|nr:Crp/Fnr family transcriptional regulator [Terriglobales bacterium]
MLISTRAVPRHYGAGETVFSEGEPCSGLYIVEKGRLRIFKSSPDGREQVLAIEGPASSVAELPVFDGGSYPASASAVENSEMLFISKEDFQALCLEHPKVALKVLRVVSRRLRGLVSMIEQLSFMTVRHRLAATLLRMAKKGKRTKGGIEFNLTVSNQELAFQIGTVRELVSRTLSQLQGEGLIHLSGRTVLVTDIRGLKFEAQEPREESREHM